MRHYNVNQAGTGADPSPVKTNIAARLTFLMAFHYDAPRREGL